MAGRADSADRREGGREAGWFSTAAVALRRYVARRVPNSADAADIAQQAVLLAWGERGAPGAVHSRAWLFAIARPLIVDYRRARSRERLVELAASLVETEPSLQTRPDMAVVVVEGRERLRALVGSVAARLRLEHQVALLLADFHGHHDRTSAALLGMSLPSFKLLLREARARLRQLQGHPAARATAKGATARRPSTPAPSVAPSIPMLEIEKLGSGARTVEVQDQSRARARGPEASRVRKVLRGQAIAVG